jgi:stage III sporulation protein AE
MDKRSELIKYMKYIKCIIYILICVTLFLLIPSQKVYALDFPESESMDFNYEEIQEVIDGVLSADNKMSFEDYVKSLFRGDKELSFTSIAIDIKNSVMNEIKSNIGILTSLISIAVIAAVFTNFSYAFQNNHVAETGFYVTYLLLFSVITASFIAASKIATETISAVLSFMKALVPTYFMAVAFSSSAGTSAVYYQATLFLITFVDLLLIRLVIPLINIYLIVSMANNLSKEDLLSKLSDLIILVTKWILKTMLAIVIGFNTLQGLILPVADKVKRSALLKAAGAIPGVGDILGSITESVLGAGVLLKNVIGVAGVVVVISICAIPLIKLVVTAIIYRISVAAVQPISDKRMLNCVTAAAEATGLLLQTVIVGAVLFLFTITIVAATTTR